MNWQYIAGFFDGEGCIDCSGTKGRFRVSISQTRERGRDVLEEIQAFLHKHGIEVTAQVRDNAKYYGHDRWEKCYILYTQKWDTCKRWLTLMLPYLRIKKVEAQDALRFVIVYPNRWEHKTFRHTKISEGVKKYWANRDPAELAQWKRKQSEISKAYFERKRNNEQARQVIN